jgi:hypothetical protein
MWCGWKAMWVIEEALAEERRPAVYGERRGEKGVEESVRERARRVERRKHTIVAELGERLAKVVHVPQLDDVEGGAASIRLLLSGPLLFQ